VKKFTVTGKSILLHSGMVELDAKQFDIRQHRLSKTDTPDVYEITNPPIELKKGVTFGYDGDLGKVILKEVEESGKSKSTEEEPPKNKKTTAKIEKPVPETENEDSDSDEAGDSEDNPLPGFEDSFEAMDVKSVRALLKLDFHKAKKHLQDNFKLAIQKDSDPVPAEIVEKIMASLPPAE
jgi:hypothetical protein